MSKLAINLRPNLATNTYEVKLSGGTVLRGGEGRWFDSSIPIKRSPQAGASPDPNSVHGAGGRG